MHAFPTLRFRLWDLSAAAVISCIFIAILAPKILFWREKSRQAACGHNLAQYGTGVAAYHDVWKAFPIATDFIDGPEPDANMTLGGPVGWQTRLLPQLDAGDIYDKINWNHSGDRGPWGVESLIPTASGVHPLRMVSRPFLRCPSDGSPDVIGGNRISNYTGNQGSQLNSSSNPACNIFVTSGVNIEEIGPFRASRRRRVSEDNRSLPIRLVGYCVDMDSALNSKWEEDLPVPLQSTLMPGNADHGDTSELWRVSGVFARHGIKDLSFAACLDGTSNIILAGETLPECHESALNRGGWAGQDTNSNAHAGTACPINLMTACATSEAESRQRGDPFPQCWGATHWNLSWGFKSRHPGGAMFVYCDGSVHFLSQEMRYETFQKLGGRRDGLSVGCGS